MTVPARYDAGDSASWLGCPMHNKKYSGGLLSLTAILVSLLLSGERSALGAEPAPGGTEAKISLAERSRAVAMTSPAEESSRVKFYVDQSERIAGFQRLFGWLYVATQQAQGQRVYCQLEKPDGAVVHFSTTPVERADVARHFNNPLYRASGFKALIPLTEDLDFDACTIRFVVQNNNGIWKSPVWQAGIHGSSRGELVPPEVESPAVKFHVNLNQERKISSHNYHCFSGWIYVTDQETRGQEVFLQVEKPDGEMVHYATTPIERADVANHFNNRLYEASGFSAFIPLDSILDLKACTIRLLVKNGNGVFLSSAWWRGIISRVELDSPKTESGAVHFYLNKNMERKRRLFHNISGWVYVKDQETRGQRVFIQLAMPDGTIVHFSTHSLRRPDVGTGFANPLYDHSGFWAEIPLQTGLDVDACALRLVVKNRFGLHKSHAWREWIKEGPFFGKLTLFAAVNWILVILTLMALLWAIRRDRSLLLKPSILAILFFHVLCQWGTALEAWRIESFLPKPWVFVLLSQGFPLIGLAGSLLIWRRGARVIWGRIFQPSPAGLARKNRALALLTVFFVVFIVLYLSRVPLHTTGLYKIVFSHTTAADAASARDMSVKFLDNAFLRYGHNIMMAVFAPLMAVLTLQILLIHGQRRKWLWALLYLAGLVAILLVASISGARSYSASIIMVVVFVVLLRRGFPIKPLQLILITLLIVAFPTLLSILREGRSVTAKLFIDYLRGSTLERIVITPMKTGLHHVQYAQQHGYFGIQAIPRLATALGVKPLHAPNFMGKFMAGWPLNTVTANTAYVYAYYSYFGLIAFLPCLIGLWLLDMSLLIYRRLSDALLIPCVACVSIGVNIFSSVEYTVGLFTFGILFLLLVSWAVDRAVPKIELAIKKRIH